MNSYYPSYPHGSLDPDSERMLDRICEAHAIPLASQTPEEARKEIHDQSETGTPNPNVGIVTIDIPGPARNIPLRVYTPSPKIAEENRPLLVFFHGGGFVLGTLDEFDPFCTFLAAGASCIVVSVDYRLAPEHKYPAAVDDAVAAVSWIAAHAEELHGDASRIAVIGDSAGANLAAVSSLVARDRGIAAIMHQVLICPWIDSSSFDTESFGFFGDGLWLSKKAMCWFRDHYLSSGDEAFDPFVSPLLANDLCGLPPALVITAEFDVLRDQGEAYARRLEAAGVPVTSTRYPGMLHDFVMYPGLFNLASDAIGEITSALVEAFARSR
ncbi:MAG TPA: alpha/beta hydrolase [Bacteroidota bacterium]|nr:alpha/beta hydrolase [Bacteroidota bacterium]